MTTQLNPGDIIATVDGRGFAGWATQPGDMFMVLEHTLAWTDGKSNMQVFNLDSIRCIQPNGVVTQRYVLNKVLTDKFTIITHCEHLGAP